MTQDTKAANQLGVLIVDDSAIYRRVLKDVVSEVKGATVVGIATNGRVALEQLKQLEVDVVLLDLEMPELNGIETLRIMQKEYPDIGAVMISGVSRHAADTTVQALQMGALDFIAKPDMDSPEANHKALVERLSPILWTFATRRRLAEVKRRAAAASKSLPPVSAVAAASAQAVTSRSEHPSAVRQIVKRISATPTKVDVVVIGVSTGGPNALGELVPRLPQDLEVPVLVVQHMPPVFTASLAKSLNRKSNVTVCEAEEGQAIEPGFVYLAPGGNHMVVRNDADSDTRRIGLNQNPPENSCRPAVDVLFRSVAAIYGGNALALIMTGMGQDGLKGVQTLKKKGSYCLTQSEETCVVYGMPLAVERAGLSDEIVPLEQLAASLLKIIRR